MTRAGHIDLGQVAPGTAEWFELGPEQPDLSPVAVCVLRGAEEGPCCALVGGVHGDEYDGIIAAAELARELDPARLRGSVVVVPVANPMAFAGAVRVTPADGKDLNRVFPGNVDGTVTERLASCLCDGIFAGADLVFSLHGSSASGVLLPWIEFLDDGTELGRTTFLAAQASGFPDLIALPHLPGVLQTALAERNIPTIEGEVGGRGSTSRANVEYYKARVADVLAHLGVHGTANEEIPAKRKWRLHTVVAGETGIFVSLSSLGADVIEGQRIAVLLNGRGSVVEEILAPATGRIGGLREHAGVRRGDRVASLWLPMSAAETR